MAGIGLAGAALVAGALCLTTGCGGVGYLAQSTAGHMDLMARAKPVPEWLADGNTSPALRERLALSQRMRDFAVQELKLPDNRSYRSYANLGRPAAVWNVVATPELSLTMKTWCFPIVGCVGYRGYFQRAEADRTAEQLKAEGLEVGVYAVPAYSTLGWTNWLGGDPLLNTFVNQPEGELARLIFHELAHQVAYAKDDTPFNESFATAVERIGSERWLREHASEAARAEYARLDQRRREFLSLTLPTRARLDALYRSDASDAAKRERKAQIFAELRAEHARMKAERWGGFAGYDPWFERVNNPALAVQAAYTDLVPGFERLFEREGRDFERFYAEVRRLAVAPKAERRAALASASP
jgi:predicted aminopeptidase